MITPRSRHSCGSFKRNDQTYVVSVGGLDDIGNGLNSTEIWISDDSEWNPGPDLPQTCIYGSLVTSPNHDGVILVGCGDQTNTGTLATDSIYKLSFDLNGQLQWETMKQKLEFARYGAVAMFVPDKSEFVNCD